MNTSKHIFWGYVAAFLVAIIWGVTGVVAKPLSLAIDSMSLVFFRYITAVIGLLVIFAFTFKKQSLNKELGSSLKIDKKDILKIAFCGIIGQGAFSFFNFLSLQHIGATENGVVQGMQPFATVLFGMAFMHFKMSKIQWIAFIISAFCIYALSIGPTTQVQGGSIFLGYLYVFLSMLSLAWTAYLRESLSLKYGSAVSMLYQYIFVVLAGIFMVFALDLDLSQINIILNSPLLIALLIFLGMGISGASYLIQLYSFKNIGVENSTMVLNLMPLVGYVTAVFALGEEISLSKSLIVLVIVACLYAFTRYKPALLN